MASEAEFEPGDQVRVYLAWWRSQRAEDQSPFRRPYYLATLVRPFHYEGSWHVRCRNLYHDLHLAHEDDMELAA